MMSSPSVLYGRVTSLPEPVHLHLYFEHQLLQYGPSAANTPASGLIYGAQTMSYRALDRRANAVARVIAGILRQQQHVSLGNHDLHDSQPIVAIDIQPSPELILALLAVMKLGAGYVPVDARSAVNRVKYILKESKPVVVLADRESMFAKEAATVWSEQLIVEIEDVVEKALQEGTNEERIHCEERLGEGRLLAVIYTSGSTGMPKGVRLCHRTAMNRLYWQWQTFPTRTDTVGCFKTSLLFVDSIVEIFSCLLSLVPLVIVPQKTVANPEALVTLLQEHAVTRLTLVPSLLRAILLYLSVSGGESKLNKLTLWISNSETLPVSLLEKFFDIFPTSKTFANLYGSTETMADVTYEIYHCSEEILTKSTHGNLSIGKPICNSNIYLLDERGYVVSGQDIGEICVSGYNVAAGYLDTEQNRCFSSNPFDTDPEYQIFYRSGDYAQMQDGRLIYHGRRDSQVKVRGQRVNIAEIEQVIQACTNVDKVVVLYNKLSEISSVLMAYFTTETKVSRGRMNANVMDACRQSLPIYMLPKLIMVDEIPLQPHSGKVDREALRKLYQKMYNRQSTLNLDVIEGKELKALNIIALNLSLPSSAISRHSSFFELGGNSVSMIATIVQLKEHHLPVSIEVFSQASTIQDILEHVCGHPNTVPESLCDGKYICKPLQEVPDAEKLIEIIADSFVEKEPLDTLLGITKTEFLPFARSLFEEALNSTLSLVVLSSSGEILGGDFLFDFSQPVELKHHPSMAPIVSLFRHFEPTIEELRKSYPGPLLLNLCLGVRKDLPHAEQVRLCHFIEHNVLVTALAHGFAGVITNNTNQATQNICEHFLHYEVLSEYLVRDFNYNGRCVFAHAPEDYKIKLMIHHINSADDVFLQ